MFVPLLLVLAKFEISCALDVFKAQPKIVTSYAIDAGFRRSPQADAINRIKGMDKSFTWYTRKEENAQFGYAVELAGLGSGVVIVSAPGNPSFKFTDPGFVEVQNIMDPPSEVTYDYKRKVDVLSPSNARPLHAHTFFGASVTVVPRSEAFGPEDRTEWRYDYGIYCGAPEGARCKDKDLPKHASWSFDNFGKVYQFEFQRQPNTSIDYEQQDSKKLVDACWDATSWDTGELQQGFAQANRNLLGFSSHLSKDGYCLVFGAPMALQQAGYVHISYRSKLTNDNFRSYQTSADIKLYYLCDPERLEKYFGYDNEHDDTEEAKLNSILCDVDLTYGYSLTSLRIPNATTGRVLYYLATGGPRASGLFGQVKIFAFDRGTDVTDDIIHRFKFLKTITGTHFNSGFGTTILGADLNGDGYDELLVGEPYRMDETSNTYNSGVVSIYGFDRVTEQFMFKFFLKSPRTTESNMFGFKVASLGDTDADGCEDVLITALTENSRGKVYLFSGHSIYSNQRFSDEKSEHAVLQEFQNPLTGLFGFSIGESRIDLDKNGFNDLVIGDPAQNGQKAYVYYANTIIRLLDSQGIQKKILTHSRQVSENCPIGKPASINFCEPLQVILRNRGVYRKTSADPNVEPKLTPWTFNHSFAIEVSLQKEPDNQLIEVYGEKQTVTFNGTEDKTITFYVHGYIPHRYGATIHLKALTSLGRGSTIELEQSFEGLTFLSPATFSHLHVAVSPQADVSLKTDPSETVVILGQSDETLVIGAIVSTKSKKDEYLVNGVLKIFLGTDTVSFSSAKSSPSGVVSCQKDGSVAVICKFSKDKAFTEAKILITLSIGKLVRGLVRQKQLVFGHDLKWGNRLSDEPLLAATFVDIIYHTELKVIPIDAFVGEHTPLTKHGSELDYGVNVINEGDSDIKNLLVDLYVPCNTSTFEIFETKQLKFAACQKYEDEKCTFESCQKYTREFDVLAGHKSETIVVKILFIDSGYWENLLSEEVHFDFRVFYNVTKAVKYGILDDKRYYPKNKEGSVLISTRVMKEKVTFPWWIVIIASIGSLLVVIALIFGLYRGNFFKKKEVNKVNDYDIDDVDGCDVDEPMRKCRSAHQSTHSTTSA